MPPTLTGADGMVSLIIFVFLIVLGAQATDFVYNGFKDEKPALLTQGIAHADARGILELTNSTQRLIGRAFYPRPLPLAELSDSFSTNFAISISPMYPTLGGHGLAFVMAPAPSAFAEGLPSQYLGLFSAKGNGSARNHIIALEFDTVRDFEFQDIDDNHIGIDVNGLVSESPATAAFVNASGELQKFDLKAQSIIRCWVDYAGAQINITVVPGDRPRPPKPLISAKLNISAVITSTVYVGFSASTGLLSSTHRVHGWSFSTTGPAAELDLGLLPTVPTLSAGAKRRGTGFVVGISAAAVVLVVLLIASGVHVLRRIRNAEKMEAWEMEYGPHRFSYAELREATREFRDSNLLGVGGFGRVYRGTLSGSGLQVAVKRVSHESNQGIREFVAEIASIGRLRHRNLVQLQGWCRYRGELLLVYDYMPNGSLDRILFADAEGAVRLSWQQRYNILRGVASALVYLHEEWEQRVLHRDVKASNVLLDADWNGRLGDFGLARLYEHGANPHTTHVVGTLGYLAPELTRTGKATAASDVFAFGALMLEVTCGRRPIEPKREPEELVLVDWLWELHLHGKLLQAVDGRLAGEYDAKEAEMLLQLGLWCSHPQAGARPSMRQVAQMLAGERPVPALPSEAPASADTPRTLRSYGEAWGGSYSDLKMGCSSGFLSRATSATSAVASPRSLVSGRD